MVRERLKPLAREHPRWGYRFLGVLLRREGNTINHKRVLRLYREEGLKLRPKKRRPKKRRKIVSVQRVKPHETTDINQRWSMDFVNDTLSCGRRFRTLTLVDCHSRECLALEVDTSAGCLGLPESSETVFYRAGQAGAKRSYRKLQWQAAQ